MGNEQEANACSFSVQSKGADLPIRRVTNLLLQRRPSAQEIESQQLKRCAKMKRLLKECVKIESSFTKRQLSDTLDVDKLRDLFWFPRAVKLEENGSKLFQFYNRFTLTMSTLQTQKFIKTNKKYLHSLVKRYCYRPQIVSAFYMESLLLIFYKHISYCIERDKDYQNPLLTIFGQKPVDPTQLFCLVSVQRLLTMWKNELQFNPTLQYMHIYYSLTIRHLQLSLSAFSSSTTQMDRGVERYFRKLFQLLIIFISLQQQASFYTTPTFIFTPIFQNLINFKYSAITLSSVGLDSWGTCLHNICRDYCISQANRIQILKHVLACIISPQMRKADPSSLLMYIRAVAQLLSQITIKNQGTFFREYGMLNHLIPLLINTSIDIMKNQVNHQEILSIILLLMKTYGYKALVTDKCLSKRSRVKLSVYIYNIQNSAKAKVQLKKICERIIKQMDNPSIISKINNRPNGPSISSINCNFGCYPAYQVAFLPSSDKSNPLASFDNVMLEEPNKQIPEELISYSFSSNESPQSMSDEFVSNEFTSNQSNPEACMPIESSEQNSLVQEALINTSKSQYSKSASEHEQRSSSFCSDRLIVPKKGTGQWVESEEKENDNISQNH